MKRIWFFLLFACLSVVVEAQYDGVDLDKITTKVYLKNGSIITGKVISYRQGGDLVIDMSGHRLTIHEDEVERLVQILPEGENTEVTKPAVKKHKTRTRRGYKHKKKTHRKKSKPVKLRESGLFFHVGGLINFSKNQNDKLMTGVGVSAAGGYQFNRYFGVGVGVGYDRYNRKRKEKIIPVFAEIKSYPFGKEKFFELSVVGGYGFALAVSDKIQDAKGGWMLYPAIGMRFLSTDGKSDILLSVGYKFQKATFNYQQSTSGDILIFYQYYRRFTISMEMMLWKK